MIQVQRGPAPAALTSTETKARLRDAARFFKVAPEKRQQQRYKFYPALLMEGVRDALASAFNNKCAYCESPVETTSGYEIDSFRPRNRAVNLDGSLSPDHYWWLIYEWSNLLFCCATCNKLKGSRFPIEGVRAAVEATDEEQLRAERPLLLDPCRDVPEVELLFDEKGKVASDTQRGRVTIDMLGLNRSTLVHARALEFRTLRNQWTATISIKHVAEKWMSPAVLHLIQPFLPFLAMRRQFVNQWSSKLVRRYPKMEAVLKAALSFRTALTRKSEEIAKSIDAAPAAASKSSEARAVKATKRGSKKVAASKRTTKQSSYSQQLKSYAAATAASFAVHEAQMENFSVTSEQHKESYFTKTRLIERIEIRNFKIIEKLTIPVLADSPEKGSWLLLLGENGMGKSSVLQATALALMGKQHRKKLKLNASEFVRRGQPSGFVKVYLTGAAEPIELHFKKGSRLFTGKPEDPKVLLLGYGATRLLPRAGDAASKREQESGKTIEAAKAYNLFNPFVPLNDATPWLWQLSDTEFDRIARSLKDLMLLNPKDRLIRNPRNRKKIEVEAFGTLVTLEDLSDGYQSVLALTTDIMSVMRKRWPAMEIAEGIVLIDEIDAHLHPSWKMKIVQRLRNVFPRLQFIVTSHDPLSLRGLHAGEVIVMKADKRNRPVAVTDLPSPEGMRVDQLLTSEYFGLKSTIDPATEEKFEQYYQLLALRKRTKSQEEKLAQLKTEMEKLEVLGSTPRERMMLQATDEYLAESSRSMHAAASAPLKDETLRKVKDLWKKIV
ncbi:MAG: hypothetical protein QOF02_2018 [Blastocatellia bacterium]|jgi:uncharacterized protein (TIGR02646 family)|nr:hypothetical protein [Blastocatellia bacterium]